MSVPAPARDAAWLACFANITIQELAFVVAEAAEKQIL
jgi:hypothetical protein